MEIGYSMPDGPPVKPNPEIPSLIQKSGIVGIPISVYDARKVTRAYAINRLLPEVLKIRKIIKGMRAKRVRIFPYCQLSAVDGDFPIAPLIFPY